MPTTRREFVNTLASGSAVLTLAPTAVLASSRGAEADEVTGERTTSAIASFCRPYRSRSHDKGDVTTWVQIDLGSSRVIEAIRLYPTHWYMVAADGFPLRFRIECSDDPTFQVKQVIADRSNLDYPDPGDQIVQFRARRVKSRYVRLTATRLRHGKLSALQEEFPELILEPIRHSAEGTFALALARIEVMSGGKDVAVHRPVTVDAVCGNAADAQQLTRAPRPQGESTITNNPRNVTNIRDWRPVEYRAQIPSQGVELQRGLFRTAMENNIRYLLESYTVDDLLRQFRMRAGHPVPASSSPRSPLAPIWEDDLAGSNAGRFLMGAGNTLRYFEHSELRSRMNAVVAGIAACRQPNGYIMAYPEDTFFVSERGAYARAWVTHGLIEAGYAGNVSAFNLLRGYYDWYNKMPQLSEALRRCALGPQGMVANTRMYFTPVGRPADIQVVQRYFQETYWLGDMAARKTDALWQYPYDRPHAYLLTLLEAYLDIYRATGDPLYLNAILGGWDLFHDNWQHAGGSISLIEFVDCPPKSNALYEKLGENCGSAFWVLLNQRLHLLDPDAERYVTEIEKSIYNVLLANQVAAEGFRTHTLLVGQKEAPTCMNTCCEGQGTRLIASLPQFIYSISDDGIYVNLFESSTISWQHTGEEVRLQMETQFPREPSVQIRLHSNHPIEAKIRIRAPSWAATVITVNVNGERLATGKPGTYVTLDRRWSPGDTISFVLPMSFNFTRYGGIDQVQGRQRFAISLGPILMAALGGADTKLEFGDAKSLAELPLKLQRVEERPLHYVLPGFLRPEAELVPYFEVGSESFSCVPIIESGISST